MERYIHAPSNLTVFLSLTALILTAFQLTGHLPGVPANAQTCFRLNSLFDNDSPEKYGYAGYQYEFERRGSLITRVLPGSPAKLAGLEEGDLVRSFKFEGNSGHGFASLWRTIAYNPHSKMLLTIQREGKSEFDLAVKLGCLNDCADPELFQYLKEFRKCDQYVSATVLNTAFQADFGVAPQVVEIFDLEKGPSPVIAEAQKRGVEVVSLTTVDPRLEALNLVPFPAILRAEPDGKMLAVYEHEIDEVDGPQFGSSRCITVGCDHP